MTIYQAAYNPTTYESSYETLSLHLTREGAEKAIREHREAVYKEWMELWAKDEYMKSRFGEFEDWKVSEIDVED